MGISPLKVIDAFDNFDEDKRFISSSSSGLRPANPFRCEQISLYSGILEFQSTSRIL